MKLLEADPQALGRRYVHVVDAAGLDACLADLEGSEAIALDTETARPRDPVKLAAYDNIYNRIEKTGELAPFDPHTAEVRLVQLKGEHTVPYVIDAWALDKASHARLGEWLRGYKGVFIGHNIRFDMKMIKGNFDIWIDHRAGIFDTMQASMLLGNSVGMGPSRGHKLFDISRDFLGQDLDKTEQASDWSVPELTPEQLEYAALDVVSLHALTGLFTHTLVDVLKQVDPSRLEMAVIGPTARMEWNGMPFNPEVYKRVQEAARFALPALLSRIGKIFKDEIGQPPILARVPIEKNDGTTVWQEMYLPWCDGKVGKDFLSSRQGPTSKVGLIITKLGLLDEEGNPLSSTKKGLLEPLRKENPGIGFLLDYWDLVKQTQFSYADYIHPLTGRCHPKFTISGAGTGRYTSSKFNGQQIPTKFNMVHPFTGEKLNYRYCFEAETGKLVCSADFSGQELTVMAKLSGDPIMIKTINDAGDLHSEAAAGMFGIDPKDARQEIPGLSGVTFRDRGKIVMFSLAFGKTAKGFATDWKMTETEAKKIVENFKKRFKVLSAWLEREGELGAAQSFSTLVNGAMRFVGGGQARGDKGGATRAAANYQIQGLSSWATRIAMIELDRRITEEKLDIELSACIHDELLSVIGHWEGCPYATLRGGGYPEFEDITARIKAADKARDKAAEKAAKVEASAFEAGVISRCQTLCEGLQCAHHNEGVIGACMQLAADTILEGVVKPPEAFSIGTARFWKH
jgi:DNA polymerase I-like protein with 3'-5' exonuclease and polymerase domains